MLAIPRIACESGLKDSAMPNEIILQMRFYKHDCRQLVEVARVERSVVGQHQVIESACTVSRCT